MIVERDCKWCGEPFSREARWGKSNEFCSRVCYDRFREDGREKRWLCICGRRKYGASKVCSACFESQLSKKREEAAQLKALDDLAREIFAAIQKAKEAIRLRKRKKIHSRSSDGLCVYCGESLATGQRRFCSLSCNDHFKKLKKRKLVGEVSRVRRLDVFRRDGFVCRYCGKLCRFPFVHGDKRSATLDHVVPIAKGGDHSLDNLVTACLSCNSKKHDAIWS